ncbi:MAG: ATP-dependent metallopeptidase FtsH/Yme1/Tma family protein, partial [Leptolyngbyaceae cyanobacterium]
MPVETNDTKLPIKTPKPRQFGGGLLILLTLLLLLNFVVPSFGPRPAQMAYSDFVAQVQAGKVDRAMIGPSEIEFTLKPDPNGEQSTRPKGPLVYSTTPIPTDLELPKILRDNGVEFGAPRPSNNGWIGTLLSWVIPPLIFFGIWGWLLNRQGG